jgi:alpha-1,3-rhamnosyltransferase
MPVSVLIPSYNHALFVERTLRSVFKQTLPPDKLIVIDDGSKDDSIKIIEKTLKDCPFDSELIVRENRGLCATLNEGLSLSNSKYFTYIGSDDVWLPRFLESRVKMMESRPNACLTYGHAYLIDVHDQIIDFTENWSDYSDGKVLEMLLYPIIPTSASIVYRTEILKKYQWNKDSKLEDYELYLRLATKHEFALGESNLSAWRMHDYNTSSDFPVMFDEWIAAQKSLAAEIGLSNEQLAQLHAKLKFRTVKDFIRRGEKNLAWNFFKMNLVGAESNFEIGKTFLRFLVPRSVFQFIRKLKTNKTITAAGKLEI